MRGRAAVNPFPDSLIRTGSQCNWAHARLYSLLKCKQTGAELIPNGSNFVLNYCLLTDDSGAERVIKVITVERGTSGYKICITLVAIKMVRKG